MLISQSPIKCDECHSVERDLLSCVPIVECPLLSNLDSQPCFNPFSHECVFWTGLPLMDTETTQSECIQEAHWSTQSKTNKHATGRKFKDCINTYARNLVPDDVCPLYDWPEPQLKYYTAKKWTTSPFTCHPLWAELMKGFLSGQGTVISVAVSLTEECDAAHSLAVEYLSCCGSGLPSRRQTSSPPGAQFLFSCMLC